MRAELVFSRLLLLFLLALASTSAWSYNATQVANNEHEASLHQSADVAEARLWTPKNPILVASNSGVPRADLSLSIHIDTVAANSIVTSVVRIRNEGPDGAIFSAQTIVPAGYRNIYQISHDGVLHGSIISWNDVSIQANSQLDLTFRVTVNEPSGAPDEYKLMAQITNSDKPDPDSTPNNDDGDQSEDDENNVVITPGADLADLRIHKSVDNPNPMVGDVVTFTIRVTDDGPAGTDYTLEDWIPLGFSNITNINRGGRLVGNKIIWSGQWIDAGETQIFTFSATVNPPDCDATDQYRNVAQITHSDRPDPDSTPNNDDGDQSEDDEDFAIVTPDTNVCDQLADLSLIKEVSDATPNIGDIITFTITINNAGPDAATNVGIGDVVPSGYSNISNIDNGGTLVGNTISWTLASLAAHASATFSFSAQVLAPTGAIDEYVNTAQITASDQPDPDSTPNNDDGDQSEDDEDHVDVTPNTGAGTADLSLDKEVSNATPNVGETITFTITVNNDGPDDATNVGISDVVPAGYTNIGNISSAGILSGNTISWLFTDIAANDNLSVTFTADVVAPSGAANEYRNTAQISASDQLDTDSTPNNDDGDQSEDDEELPSVLK